MSVVLATYDAAGFLHQAVTSVLRQTIADLELVVVDDASGDDTPELLAAYDDPRLVVLRNEEQLGLAASLNRGLDAAGGRYVARLDADDVALPDRLERQLGLLGRRAGLALLGSGVLEIDAAGNPGTLHVPPVGEQAVRWSALFGTPFFHPTVILERDTLERHGLRYDTSFPETEDYDLWSRLLLVAAGDNAAEPLVLRRVHHGQATRRRSGLQREHLRRVALRETSRAAPELDPDAVSLAWSLGAAEELPPGRVADALEAFLALLDAFEREHGRSAPARRLAARQLVRAALDRAPQERSLLARRALLLDPAVSLRWARSRLDRPRAARAARSEARRWLRELAPANTAHPVRVTVVSPEPTPYRSPLFDLIAARKEVELTVIYAARTVADRTWTVEPRHEAVFLEGVRIPGVRWAFRHDYPVTPGVFRALREARPDVVVVSGWSQFASQAAMLWCRRRRVPYVLLVSTHDAAGRPAWRRAVRKPVVPAVVRGAWGAFVIGTLSRASMISHGVAPQRVRLFANTVDVEALGERADRLAGRRPELRAALGLEPKDVAVLFAGRLSPEKGLDVLVRAVAEAADPRLVVVLAGDGPGRGRVEALARELGVRLQLTGDLAWAELAEAYVAADVFALLSAFEAWGVVVNEAAACGKPLVLSDQVGAAPDLLRDGENGFLVPAGDVTAAAAALRRLADDAGLRLAAGARSRELVRGWGYGPSVESFVATVREAAGG